MDINLPPPPDESSFSSMREWLAALRAHSNQIEHIKTTMELKRMAAELGELGKQPGSKRRPISTYAAQIEQWYATLPAEAKSAPRGIEEFISMLEGRTKGLRAHPGEVAKVLRSLGWVRYRCWTGDAEGRRLWLKTRSNGS